MATLNPVSITGDWTLVYDSAVSGTFSGALHTTGEPIGIFIGDSLPSASAAGIRVGAHTPLKISYAAGEKLYAKAYDGAASVLLDMGTAPSAFPQGVLTSPFEGVARIATDSQPSAFYENSQFRLFDDISALNAGDGVPHTSQLVYHFETVNPVIVYLRQINIWQGGRRYLVYPADGNETYSATGEVDISDQLYPTNGILHPGLSSQPATTVTVKRKIGAGIFSTTSKPRNSTASLTDGNANRAASAYTANGDQGGVGGGSGFYLVFDHIGANNETKGLFLVAYSEIFS